MIRYIIEQVRFKLYRRRLRKQYLPLVKGGMSPDEMIVYLRSAGVSKGVSLLIIDEVFEMKAGEAKRLVHTSPTWADVRASDEAMWEELADEEFWNGTSCWSAE